MKKRVMKRCLSAFLAAIMVFSSAAYDFPAVVNAAPADYETADTSVSENGLIYVDETVYDDAAYSDEISEEDEIAEEDEIVEEDLLDEETVEDVPYAGAGDYGLCDNIQDGVILHCFDWKYSDIEAELPNIAAAGFTSVQTSPAQRDDGGDREIWYMLYQPQSFAIASNPLGTKAELESLCKKAEEYGVKVIVDVVANHTRGMAGENGDIDANLKKREFFRYDNKDSGNVNWQNRTEVWSCNIGMRDLVSENTELQGIIAGYIQELKSVGVDGIRWDAAKHIQLPSEGSQFWPNVTSQGLYHYGEILEGPDDRESGNESLMKEYTNYMSVTDNGYGSNLTGNFRDGKVITENGKWINKNAGITANRLVYWAESHDTYANDVSEGGWTKNINQNVIDRAYAIAASRKDATALYFSRPSATAKTAIKAGVKGSTHFTSKEVAEVNHFHNVAVGEKEYYVGDTNNNVAAVCRESGAVVVLGSGSNRDVTVSNGGGTVKPGTYTDQISGSTWTVTSSTMSGRVGDKGIAVFYNAKPVVKTPKPTISKEGGSFNDTLTLTIGLSNATSGTYKIGNGTAKTYTSSTQITIGSDMAFGDSVTITLTATDGSQTETKSYTFTKVDKVVNKAYLSLPSGWSEPVKCYAYDSATEKINNVWPGVEMTKDSATGYYVYEIPENIEKPRVIFYSSDTNRYPADFEDGLLFETDGSYLYKDKKWEKYTPPVTEGTVIVKYVDTQGNSVAAPQTLKGAVGSSYTTSAAQVTGYKIKTTPNNASGTYTAAGITVTYVYERVVSNTLDVTSSLADGTTFETETTKITLTAQNAISATYSVDDGPVKTFTNSASVIIGQGKIADRDVTVKVTATDGTNTVNKTFTYKKKFSGNVVNETVNDIPRAASGQSEEAVHSGAASALASQYATNGTGYGKEATITIDGSISDWDESMLIAQGAAWDVPNHWKGTHENCVIDTYSLYAAYDNDNLYVGVQMVNVGDTIYYNGCGALLDGGVPGDVPLIVAIDTGKGNKMTGKLADGKYIWGAQVDFNNMADNLLYMSCKPGLGQPSIFKAGADGLANYTDAKLCISFKDAGISYNVAHECLPNKLMGLNHNEGKIEDILDSNGPWVDYKTFTDNEGSTHSSKYDSFFEVAIPYTALGITKADITQNGVGILAVGTRGESGLDCVPYDYDAMTDNIMADYSADSSTSGEKDDVDVLKVNYARVGSSNNPNPNPTPDPTPGPTTDLTVNFGADRSSPQLNTTSLTLQAIASGGKSAYTYEFFVDGASVQGKSSKDTYTWRPSVGSHTIKVTVTDSAGKTVSSQKAYVIERNGDQPIVDPSVINISFANPDARYVYDGNEHKPDVIVKDGTKTLVKDRDYSLLYYNYIDAGDKDSSNAPTVIVVGKGDYAAKIINHIMTYTIEKAAIPNGAPESEMRANAGLVSDLTLNAGWEWSESDKNTVLQTGSTISVSAVYNGEDKANYMITTVSVRLTGITCDHVGTEKETIVAVAPTCTQTGRSDVICKECHTRISTGAVIPALGHRGGTATCSSQAICGRCKQKYGSFNNENHANIVVRNKKEANCQQAGYTGDAVCEDCNSMIASGKPVAKTDHKWDGGKVTKAPTATANGVRTYTCTVCKTATRTETIPKTGGGSSTVPGESLQVGDPVMDTASKAIYKVTQASSTVKTVEFILPSGSAKTVTIPDNIVVKGTTYQVTSVADSAFKNNKTIQTVKLGRNVKAIGTNAFAGCSKLKKVTLSSNTTTIGSKAFYKCTGLTSITIPSKVNKIGSKAFYGCKKLKKITIKTTKLTKKKVGSQAFKGIAAKATIKVPKKKLSAYKKMLRARGVGAKAKIKK